MTANNMEERFVFVCTDLDWNKTAKKWKYGEMVVGCLALVLLFSNLIGC